MQTKTLLYIHGFNSSPASSKAQALRASMDMLRRADGFLAPALPHAPAAAAHMLEKLVQQHPHSAVVGSSLGGFYATYLAEKFALRAVLINPAVRPYDLLIGEIGRQKNFHTGEEYLLTTKLTLLRL